MNQSAASSSPYWSHPVEDLYASLQSGLKGLSLAAAQERLVQVGRNELITKKKATPLWVFFNQFRSPLVLILVFAAVISIITGELLDASIILAIVLASAVMGFVQEYRACM